MARPPLDPADELELAASIGRNYGNMSAVARECGVTRATVHKWISESEKLTGIKLQCREILLDEAEFQLGKAVRSGEAWAVKYSLSTLGRERGYTAAKREPFQDTGPTTTAGIKKPAVLRMPDNGRGPAATDIDDSATG